MHVIPSALFLALFLNLGIMLTGTTLSKQDGRLMFDMALRCGSGDVGKLSSGAEPPRVVSATVGDL